MIGFAWRRHKWFYHLTIHIQIKRPEWYRMKKRLKKLASREHNA